MWTALGIVGSAASLLSSRKRSCTSRIVSRMPDSSGLVSHNAATSASQSSSSPTAVPSAMVHQFDQTRYLAASRSGGQRIPVTDHPDEPEARFIFRPQKSGFHMCY